MEFEFPNPPALRESQDPIVTINAATVARTPNGRGGVPRGFDDLLTIIDSMGQASAKAQKLPQVITTAERLRNSNHRLYMLRDIRSSSCVVLGIIKVGEKKLFLYDNNARLQEREPTCVLDFYIHESCQRTGLGRLLYDYMLVAEGVEPHQLAVDRPSHKFLCFLGRHFNLKSYNHQSNNYVVFKEFFLKSHVTTRCEPQLANQNNSDNTTKADKCKGSTSDFRSSGPPLNPPSRFSRGTPGNQMKTSSGFSAAFGYTPPTRR